MYGVPGYIRYVRAGWLHGIRIAVVWVCRGLRIRFEISVGLGRWSNGFFRTRTTHIYGMCCFAQAVDDSDVRCQSRLFNAGVLATATLILGCRSGRRIAATAHVG